MKRILCFGDSNTWGYDPASGARFAEAVRWPSVMGGKLGADCRVIEEALAGRTTVFDSPYADHRSGRALLLPLLESHLPLDLVIIMLGTNDLQGPLELSARHSASGLYTLLDLVARSRCGPDGNAPAALVVVPPPLGAECTGFMGVFFEGRQAESRALAGHYATICRQLGVACFDAAQVVAASVLDGVHLDQAGHARLGEALAEVVRPMVSGKNQST